MHRTRLVRDVASKIRAGHPWIYLDALDRRSIATIAPGSILDVLDRDGSFVARGFRGEADGPIGVRVLSVDDTETIDTAFIAHRIASACALRRAAAHAIDSDAVRILHGEGDFVPGIVLDLYAGTAAIRFDGAAAAAMWRPHVATIIDTIRDAGFPVERAWLRGERGRREQGEPLVGDPPPQLVTIREGLARFEVDVVRGQKTGFFLDQRTNRRVVARACADQTVLNLFSYTGGFSIACALAGARRVTTVDLAKPAIEAARRNFERNGIDPDAHELVAADAFAFLEQAAREGRSWDVVITDPPSFAPSERARPGALGKYRQLAALAASVTSPSGLLVSASCSSHVTLSDFQSAVAEGIGSSRRTARITDIRVAAPDHPIVPAFPEGNYLKALFTRVA
jgi:23S rRNA (cytosine1962-C5)-methyltransferase